MAFEARYDGTCEDCGGRFHSGDRIRLVEHVGERFYAHESCPDDPQTSLRPGEVVCETCFMVKPCPCEDGL